MTELYNYRDQMGKPKNQKKLLACVSFFYVIFKIVKARSVKCFRIK